MKKNLNLPLRYYVVEVVGKIRPWGKTLFSKLFKCLFMLWWNKKSI